MSDTRFEIDSKIKALEERLGEEDCDLDVVIELAKKRA